VPAFILRNLYYVQGSPEAGWILRFGTITPDGLVASSDHLDAETTFLPTGGTGPCAIALPDSGVGAGGLWFLNDRVALGALVSDANGDRFDWGDPGEGDLFKAAELHVRFAPEDSRAGFSKLTLWHTDGTSDGEAINGQLGPDGWGFHLKHEQQLTSDDRALAIFRYGMAMDDSAVYEQQAAAHFLLYEPRLFTHLENDLVGVAFNWARPPIAGTRDEYHLEAFYRFPIFPDVDMTLSYQSIWDPAFEICPQHLPLLIHDPARLIGKLPGAEKLRPADHHD
jgi:hypothetical protein